MGIIGMKVHQFARGGGFWGDPEPSSLLTLGICKRQHPLTHYTESCFTMNTDSSSSSSNNSSTGRRVKTTFDLKSFIKPESSLISSNHSRDSPQVETHPGGTRWNPTQDQIGILEMLYSGGMRTPNAQQIEQITAQLGKYGKIEGKNVFYWFQNHKARERQKQKRNNLGLNRSLRSTPASTIIPLNPKGEVVESPYKRKCMSWPYESLNEDDGDHKTLELFPLHPEGKSRLSLK